MKFIVTGSCGFIGSHLCEKLLNNKQHTVVGIDNLNSVIYDKSHKLVNLDILTKYENYIHITDDFSNVNYVDKHKPDVIIHLAAYANVRKSNLIPDKFIENNVQNTCKLLEFIKNYPGTRPNKPYFIYASSSSVYGKNTKIPFSENDKLDNIASIYALSKKICEDMVDIYCKNYGMKSIGFRFFTVYGPRGRPDMAIRKFITSIKNGENIKMFGDGSMKRDYTYVGDIVDGIINSLDTIKTFNESEHRIYNLGNNDPILLKDVIQLCAAATDKIPIITQQNIPKGDVPITYADITKAKKEINYNPNTKLKDGILKCL